MLHLSSIIILLATSPQASCIFSRHIGVRTAALVHPLDESSMALDSSSHSPSCSRTHALAPVSHESLGKGRAKEIFFNHYPFLWRKLARVRSEFQFCENTSSISLANWLCLIRSCSLHRWWRKMSCIDQEHFENLHSLAWDLRYSFHQWFTCLSSFAVVPSGRYSPDAWRPFIATSMDERAA